MVSEHTSIRQNTTTNLRLNPYFVGRWFRRGKSRLLSRISSLNPYFVGRWFRRTDFQLIINFLRVLILILLEDGFGVINEKTGRQNCKAVLILILLEDGFGEWYEKMYLSLLGCLNPYFVGRWFRSQ